MVGRIVVLLTNLICLSKVLQGKLRSFLSQRICLASQVQYLGVIRLSLQQSLVARDRLVLLVHSCVGLGT